MTKRFCDRCGKESNNTKYVKFSYVGYKTFGDNEEVNIELCEDCQKETGIFDFIEKNTTKYDNKPVKKSIQDRFFELFKSVVCETINQ